MSRLASLTPSRARSSPRHTPSPSASPRATSPSPAFRPNETTYHRKLRLIIIELKNVFKTWDELVLADGLKAGKGCVDGVTEIDNILQLPESAERPPIEPLMRDLLESRAGLSGVLAKLEKLLIKLAALVEQAETLYFDAYRTQGYEWVTEEPLWLSWPFEHFVNSLPPLVSLHHHHLHVLTSLSTTLQSSEREFDEAKLALERWRDLGMRGERWEGVREWEELVELELTLGGTELDEEKSAIRHGKKG